MIARIWHGAIPEVKAEEYRSYLEATGLADLRATAGNLGVVFYWRVEDELANVLLTSFWKDLAAIEAFAGAQIEKARYYPRDPDYLVELEPTVTHYEIAGGDLGEGFFTALRESVGI